MAHVRVVVGVAAVPILLLAGAGSAGAAATPPALRLVDDTHTITVDVPAAWTDVDTSPKVNRDGTPQPWIAASTDLPSFLSSGGFSAPGVFFQALPRTPDTAALLAAVDAPGCTDLGVGAYDDGAFVGHVRRFSQCGGTPARQFMIAATHRDGSFTAFVLIQLLDADDSPAAMIAGSFYEFGAPAVTPGTGAGAVPSELVGDFEQTRNLTLSSENPVLRIYDLTIGADGSYALSVTDPSTNYAETGSVVAGEDPCVAKNVHTGSVEFFAEGAVDPQLTLSGRGPARWTVGPDAYLLTTVGEYQVALEFQFGDHRGHSAQGLDLGIDAYDLLAPVGACIP